jgi:hypothetical protein
MTKYYLITENCREGDYEYYSYIPVSTTTPRNNWDDNWENLFLCWQYSCTSIDKYGLWSDQRIVSISEVKEITFDEYNTLRKLITNNFKLDEILKEGRKTWIENELQEQQDSLN